MFQGLMLRAQARVETALTKLAGRAAVALPFLIALGFGTAAAAMKLNEEFGPIMANLILAGAFCALGLLLAAILAVSQPTPVVEQLADEGGTASTSIEDDVKAALPNIDPDTAIAALTALGPTALPAVGRFVMRNLPLLISIALALFFLSRSIAANDESAATDAEPAAA